MDRVPAAARAAVRLGVTATASAPTCAARSLPYVDPYIFLFLGGMGIAAAMQQWNLHRRIALP